jgi:nucleoside phosphorylase
MVRKHGSVVIITALGLEYRAVRAWLAEPRRVVHPSGTRYEVGRLNDSGSLWELALVEIGEGNPGAAALTTQAIGQFDPDIVLFVGIAGSLVDSVRLGDVVAAIRVDAYQGGKQVARQFLQRPVTWPSDWLLDQAARQVRQEGRWLDRLGDPPSQMAGILAERPPEVHLKAVLAGDVVLDSRESRLYQFLRKNYNDAVAIEMEGIGLATAAHASGGVPAMIVRGISDLAGGAKAETDAAGWQPQAAQHAAAFALELLSILSPDEVPPRPGREVERSEPLRAATDPQKTTPNLVYDSEAEEHPFAGWTLYVDGGIRRGNFVFHTAESGPAGITMRSIRSEPVGVNKSLPTLAGTVEFQYQVLEAHQKGQYIYFAMIPMQETGLNRTGLIEVGGERQDDPRNPTSIYRIRRFVPRKHYMDGHWHTASMTFDFRELSTAFYSILAPRINEGIVLSGPAVVRIGRVRVWSI